MSCPRSSPHDRLAMHLAQAETRALSAEAREHIRAARRELDALPVDDC
jgi:hypothetical protein